MSQHRMKRCTKVFLLVIVVAGGVAALVHNFGGHFDARADRMVSHMDRQLELDVEQRRALNGLKSDLLGLKREMRELTGDGLDQWVDMIVADELDQQRMLTMIEDKTRQINEQAPQLVASLARFTDSLDASQKSILKEKLYSISERRDNHHHW
ncbi:MAG: hypothetical protein DHS20C01_05470 [marine bacterium B5-7]|nr:MAG: hypothetical protein DHS20C01_05470 [marine bacterium B5-7]